MNFNENFGNERKNAEIRRGKPTKSFISLLEMTFESSKLHQLIAIYNRMFYCQVARYTKATKIQVFFVDGPPLVCHFLFVSMFYLISKDLYKRPYGNNTLS